MSKKCIGCGSIMQFNNPLMEGYINEENYNDANICLRCFKIKNYSSNVVINKDISFYKKIFDNIKAKNNLILFLVDILEIDDTLKQINEFKGKKILVITKKDILPKSIKESKIIGYIRKNYQIKDDIVFISSNKNYNLDRLYELINKYNNKNDVYLVGKTNAGKSSLINKLIKSYGNKESFITTSNFPATTLDLINIKLNDNITLIDTPGLINNEFLSSLNNEEIKKITIKKEIKPRTFQIKENESILIDNYARLDYLGQEENSVTIYLSNDLLCKKISFNKNNMLRNLSFKIFNLDDNKDIVISSLCFCKITKKGKFVLYKNERLNAFERNNLI